MDMSDFYVMLGKEFLSKYGVEIDYKRKRFNLAWIIRSNLLLERDEFSTS